ncbi:hypothetical protein H4Q26_003896 [Puccinia striiformis f. sp. tritici PST-130]|uniref:Uncharacterized protein n=1 Tax=Puccinia striiformis f. sp. tritici PST-78 TaxID=1165861 RepID=A0A0L0V6Y6_9BASI|nr:hypothetical protein H4Q26_003896 [Puccinia striiformis f. sp. tritici PST-130]KNE95065.1 hypothetical protein PSTG_11545 [Puccinia striiformis f. sp. tritici PST-78]
MLKKLFCGSAGPGYTWAEAALLQAVDQSMTCLMRGASPPEVFAPLVDIHFRMDRARYVALARLLASNLRMPSQVQTVTTTPPGHSIEDLNGWANGDQHGRSGDRCPNSAGLSSQLLPPTFAPTIKCLVGRTARGWLGQQSAFPST